MNNIAAKMNLICFTLLVILATAAAAEKKIVCYYGTWSTYRYGNGQCNVNDIDPTLCTHLMYSFFGIKENGEFRIIDPYLDLEENWGRGNVKLFNNLKTKNPNLKTLAAVGGWNEGSYKFSEAAKDPAKRKRFINSAIEFILKHNFDGLDLDWEYPGQRDGDSKVDKANYIAFLKELKEELSKHNLLLTAAVASAEFSSSISYDIPQVAKYLDFINVMAYDLHGSWDSTIGINAPLYAGPTDITEKEKQLNVHSSIQYWINQGAPASKIILGVPLYGRTFQLSNNSNVTPGSKHVGPGNAGRYSNQPGMIGYNEICELFKAQQWNELWESTQQVPYAHLGNQWIGYDNEYSIELKANYANKHGLGGVMVWSVETDDFKGVCGTKFPLLKKINQVLDSKSTAPPVPSTPSTARPTVPGNSTTKPTSPPSFTCEKDGTFRDPHDCSVFYICVNLQRNTFKCPAGLLFDINLKTCNYPNLVDC